MIDRVGTKYRRDRDEPVAPPQVADMPAAAQGGAKADHPMKGEPGEDGMGELVLEDHDEVAE